jgi:hypothetical protein
LALAGNGFSRVHADACPCLTTARSARVVTKANLDFHSRY